MSLDPTLSERYRLDNGLTVVLKEQHGSPVVAFQTWVGVGSADEPEHLAGIAHVFEHMLFKGTARRGVGRIAREVEAAGGDINAWTSFDQTVYHLVLSSRFFDTGLDILTDAIRNSSFDPVELSRELKVVLEEVKQGEDSPSRVCTQALFANAYRKHTYRRPVIGYVRTVEKFRRAALLDFFRRWYVPNNVTLIVVGDFDTAQAKRKIAEAWKGAKRRALPEAKRVVEVPQRRARVVVAGGEVSEVHVVAGFHVPPLRHPQTAALEVGSIILGQGDSSRLQLEVKRKRQVVSDAYAYAFTPKDAGLMVVGATLPPDKLDDAVGALLDETFRISREPPSEAEVEKARAIIESDAVYQKETVQGMARKLGFYETVAGAIGWEREYLDAVRAVTPDAVRAAMADCLKADNCTLSLLVPGEKQSSAVVEKKRLRRIEASVIGLLERAAIGSAPELKRAPKKHGKGTSAAQGLVTRVVLPSGARVLVMREPSVPLVAMRAVWLGGLRDETAADNGISNLLSTLVTRGTEMRTGDEIAHEIEALAGAIGGFSGRNSFGIRAEVMARHFDHGLAMLAECVLHPRFADDEIDKERRQIYEELRTQQDNVSSVAFRSFVQALYARHPYRMDMLGTRESLAALDRQRLRDYYFDRFHPAGMAIAIVGDVDPEATVAQVARLLDAGARPQPLALRTVSLDAPPPSGLRVRTVLAKQQAHLVVGFPGTTISAADRFPLEVLSTILSGQGGRLFTELREKRGLAYRVSAFTLEGIDPGYVAVYVATGPENLVVAEEAIGVELAKVRDRKIGAAELARAKRYLAGSHDISLQRRSALAATLSFSECYGIGWDQYLRYSPAILSVTADDVQRVAQKYLDPARAVVAIVSPDAAQAAASVPVVPSARAARAPSRPAAGSNHKRRPL